MQRRAFLLGLLPLLVIKRPKTFRGRVSDVRIFDWALSPKEIAELVN